jgi:hypothetical protein
MWDDMIEQTLRKLILETLLNEQPPSPNTSASGTKQPKLGQNSWSDFPTATASLKGRSGVGPGEDRLAEILAGVVQGQAKSYDLEIPASPDAKKPRPPWLAADKDNPFAGKWEIKAPDKAGTIRPGTEGIRAFGPLNKALRNAFDDLDDFIALGDMENLAANSGVEEEYKQIRKFIQGNIASKAGQEKGEVLTNSDLISRGEITDKRFKQIISVFEVVGELIRKMGGDSIQTVTIDGKQYEVTPTTMVRISKLLGIDEVEIDERLGDTAQASKALTILNSPAFLNVEELKSAWNEVDDSAGVFDLDGGIILVNHDGFLMIPKSKIASEVKFSRVTQGKPRFKVPMKGHGKFEESIIRDLTHEIITEALLLEELTSADKKEIEKISRKQAQKEIRKVVGNDLSKTIQEEIKKALKNKATKQEVADITKAVIKKLYRELAVTQQPIIDRIKI